MNYGICNLSIIPVRAEASDKSEMVTQLLFGDAYEIIDETEKWLKVRIQFDQYEGWIDRIMHTEVSADYHNAFKAQQHPFLTKYSTIVYQGKLFYPILMGSTLPFYDGEFIKIGEQSLLVDGTFTQKPGIKEAAFMYYNAPYLWGGKSPYGIDCSGLTQQVYKMNGIALLRDASQQISQGEEVALSDYKPGDLAFFHNDKGAIVHVGIMLEEKRIIHAHGRVRVDILDEKGIYIDERKTYSHQFHSIRRYF